MQRRESRQDISACMRDVLALLVSKPMRYVTAGWIEDRGVGYSEHTIAVACRRLVASCKLDHVVDDGFQRYAYRTDLKEVLEQREKKRKLAAGEEYEPTPDSPV